MAKHLFKPGQSGNPNARPKGSGKAARFRKMLESDAPDVIATVGSAAKNGDRVAAKMILDRIVPVYADGSGSCLVRWSS
jgi:hypothetical protein